MGEDKRVRGVDRWFNYASDIQRERERERWYLVVSMRSERLPAYLSINQALHLLTANTQLRTVKSLQPFLCYK